MTTHVTKVLHEILLEFEKTFKVLYPGLSYKKRPVFLEKDELIRQRNSFKISARPTENFPPAIIPPAIPPTVIDSAPVDMPPPVSLPPKKAASKSASIKNSTFVDDSLKEIIKPKVTRSKKEQTEKPPQPSPEIEVIANPN
jgi:hypothetical protein